MLHALSSEAAERPVWFVHGARDGDHHPLAGEVRALAEKKPGIRLHTAYSNPRPEDMLGRDYDSEGRIDGALLADITKSSEAHYLLCGPVGFMTSLRVTGSSRKVSLERRSSSSPSQAIVPVSASQIWRKSLSVACFVSTIRTPKI